MSKARAVAVAAVFLAVFISGWSGSGGSASAAPLGARATSGNTWTLVPTTCTGSQVAVGLGCWDGQAENKSEWQVNQDSASWTDPAWMVQYTYTVPSSISPSGAAVPLSLNANDYTATAGIAPQLCIQSAFGVVESGDPCVRADAATPHSSQSASETFHIPPTTTGSIGGFQVTFKVGIQDGGNIYFTYHAQAAPPTTTTTVATKAPPTHHVSFNARATFSKPRNSSHLVEIEMTLSGSFVVQGSVGSGSELTGSSPAGTANIHLNGVNSADLALTGAKISSAGVYLTFQVVRGGSGAACLPKGATVELNAVTVRGRHTVVFGPLCGQGSSDYRVSTAAVNITSS